MIIVTLFTLRGVFQWLWFDS